MANRTLPIAAALAALGACASLPDGTTAEVMIGSQVTDGGFYPGHGATATLRLRHRMSERTFCEYEHVSHLFEGPPFGPRSEEDWLDQVGCGLRFGQ